jgi:uncharacterized protein YdaU (DUF1376 family)
MEDRPKKLTVNATTGEEILEYMTDEEIAELKELEAKHQAEKAAWEAEQKAKAEAKASAIAKLAALGLTEEEAAALAGN